ncbi:hypothetical protein [Microbacterium sp. MPKO10]|uniref:hypothetical protein n=1 Tax=Microbacterium sp. MPKO10 TaxID=2989818 RepID=UPI00223609D2|nr:hypothetical protein [Microbacterium sp. MPKO10]MCW4458579.1 hypothetical protein [Microbacterium sp. MPKO10]
MEENNDFAAVKGAKHPEQHRVFSTRIAHSIVTCGGKNAVKRLSPLPGTDVDPVNLENVLNGREENGLFIFRQCPHEALKSIAVILDRPPRHQ